MLFLRPSLFPCLLVLLLCWQRPATGAFFSVSTVEGLVAALDTAIANGQDDTISIAEGIYYPASTLTYDSGEDNSLILVGEGRGAILDGSNSNHRLLFIRTSSSGGNINLKNITLQNGYSPEGENGAGMLINIASADLLIEEVVIKNCFGGAFYFSTSGGGAYITCGLGANLIMRNCIISGNSAKGYGGGLYLSLIEGRLDFINNTIINNHNRAGVIEWGGGVYLRFFYDTSEAFIHNNIFRGNTWAYGDGDLSIENNRDGDATGTPIDFTHNNIGVLTSTTSNGLTNANNLTTDPLLDTTGYLQHGSPCIDGGSTTPLHLPLIDIAGNNRSLDGNCDAALQPDLGAFEYLGTPEVETSAATDITSTSALSGGEILSEGGYPVTERGVCWSLGNTPDLEDTCSSDGTGPGLYTSTLSGLLNETIYHLRAYARNCLGYAYGEELTFITSALPKVTTGAISAITPPYATGGGEVLWAGDTAVISRGVCWSFENDPDLGDTCTSDGSGTGRFSSLLYNLSEDLIYFVRAYATNTAGTSYGQQIQFMATRDVPQSPWLLFLPAIIIPH